MCRQAYLFPCEYMSGQFHYGKVSTAQRLIQVIEPGDLPIVMPFEPRHGHWWTRGGGGLLLPGGFRSVLHFLLSRFKSDSEICWRLLDVDFLR